MTHPDHPDHPDHPAAALHVLRGDPGPLELAVLTAVLLAARRTAPHTPAPRAGARARAAWNPPGPGHNRPSWKTPP
ncbi:acyl-CoA carboxylase epsilon subunit [Kitasatospora indigofera]|uniref:acyl-CoA carboxylase epsilon subunit n=1 Tax=Kitasatospora indigofera TaxID=67307 RepID=UPI003638A107